jgi:hypothetical protein
MWRVCVWVDIGAKLLEYKIPLEDAADDDVGCLYKIRWSVGIDIVDKWKYDQLISRALLCDLVFVILEYFTRGYSVHGACAVSRNIYIIINACVQAEPAAHMRLNAPVCKLHTTLALWTSPWTCWHSRRKRKYETWWVEHELRHGFEALQKKSSKLLTARHL